jgi:hypothetical protein
MLSSWNGSSQAACRVPDNYLIARPANEPVFLLRAVRDEKQRPVLGVERKLDDRSWVDGATSDHAAASPLVVSSSHVPEDRCFDHPRGRVDCVISKSSSDAESPLASPRAPPRGDEQVFGHPIGLPCLALRAVVGLGPSCDGYRVGPRGQAEPTGSCPSQPSYACLARKHLRRSAFQPTQGRGSGIAAWVASLRSAPEDSTLELTSGRAEGRSASEVGGAGASGRVLSATAVAWPRCC